VPTLSVHRCAVCGDERPFERPPCADGHGDLCPELACVDCGTAILLEPPAFWPLAPAPALSAAQAA
jgi:hypothetical protein